MNKSLYVRIGKEYTKLLFSDIIYVESVNNYIRIVTSKNKYMIKVAMGKMEKILPRDQFCRIHRSYIVSLHFMTGFNYDNVHIPGKQLPVSEQYRQALLDCVTIVEVDSLKLDAKKIDKMVGKLIMN